MEEYIKAKLKILKELQVRVTEGDIKYMKSLKTEAEVDRFARDLIMKGE